MSLKTVSRVINAEAGVAPATAARVTEAIAALGFERNDLARSLRQGRSSSTLGPRDRGRRQPVLLGGRPGRRGRRARARLPAHHRLRAARTPSASASWSARCCGRRVDALLIVPAGPDHRYIARRAPARVFLDRPPQRDRRRHRAARQPRRRAPRGRAPARPRPHADRLRRRHARSVYTARERLAGYRAALAAAGARGGPGAVAHAATTTRPHAQAVVERAARAARRAPPDRDLHRQQPQHGRRAARARRPRRRTSRWSASTTSSSPTCSAPPSCAPTPGASASRRPRSPSRGSTATTRPPRDDHGRRPS